VPQRRHGTCAGGLAHLRSVGISLDLRPVVNSDPQSLRVALIGYGFAGKTFHAPLISAVSGLALTHVASSDASKVLRDWPGVRVVATPDEAFRNPEIDVVAIATPNTTHFDLARNALLAGKHVVVDKPFTITVGEASELIALSRSCSRLLSVFHDRRWDADFLTVRELLASGRLGEVVHFESHYDRFRPEVRVRWRELPGPGSGIWYDLGYHLVDQALQLFGVPDTILADFAAQRKGGQVVDYFHVVLCYGPRRVILHGGSLVHAGSARFVIHGTRGSFVKNGMDPQEEALKAGRMPGGADWGVDPRDGTLFYVEGGELRSEIIPTLRGNYGAYYQGVHDAIRNGGEAPVTTTEAIRVMTILELAARSDAMGIVMRMPDASNPPLS
jgi:predicted dehydrogenase